MVSFGNTIGAGIFSLSGVAAKFAGKHFLINLLGPAIFISFLLAGVTVFLTGLVYAEFASKMPFSGSGYVYTYTTFGELPAWVVGWNLNLRFGIAASTQSRAMSMYIVTIIHLCGGYVPTWIYDLKVFGYVIIVANVL